MKVIPETCALNLISTFLFCFGYQKSKLLIIVRRNYKRYVAQQGNNYTD